MRKTPTKQLQNLSDDDRTIWTTELVNQSLEAIENGHQLSISPFHEHDIQWKKGNLLFEYTSEELEEIEKCANDVIHFSQYCYVMQDHGLDKIKLRDYQEEVLNEYQNPKNRMVALMASRQCGKCVFDSTIEVRKDDKVESICLASLYYREHSKKTFLGKIKNFLIKLHNKLT